VEDRYPAPGGKAMAGKGRRDGPRAGAPASRRRARGRKGRRRPPIEVLIVLGGIVVGLGAWMVVGGGASAKHPEPRPDITGVTVVPASRYAGYARVADVYRRAAQVAPVLDGLYCYCQCKENIGHKSLLSCYVGRHAST